ncbi:hypothetical protein ACOTH8_23410 [Achromobacter xylosoxidans]
MTNQNNAAQAANENPLSDEFVNAIIQRHGYDSPETVIARLAQWIGLHGGENGTTLLMYEAHKALSKLRAPVADERPIQLSAGVLEYLKEGVESATQCEESDVDQAFADQLLLLMHTPLYTEPPPKQRKVDWGPLVVAPVADERAAFKLLDAWQAVCDRIVDQYGGVVAGVDFAALGRANRTALASAPVAGEVVARDDGAQSTSNRPKSCAKTGSTGGAQTPVAVQPFMYGIMGPDGKAHFEEFCVSGDRDELQAEVVDHLNRDNTEDGPYSVVALFRDFAPQASRPAQQRVAYTDSCGRLHWTNGRKILTSLYAAPQASECECSRKSKAVSDSEAQL